MTPRPPSILVPAPEDTTPATQAQRDKDDLSQQSDRLVELDASSSTAQRVHPTYSDYDVSPESTESSQQTDLPLSRNVVATMEDNHTHIRSLRFWCVFAVILSQYSLVFFDQSLINTVHPTITREFHAPNLAPWLETAFFIASTASQPLSGRLSDTCGRRKVQLGSLIVYCIAVVLCATAGHISGLVGGRILGGIGAGGVLAMSPILTNDLIDIGVRGTYQGFINIAVGISSAAGAAVGGWITYKFGWRWAFGIQAPAALAVLAVAFATTPPHLGLRPSLAGEDDVQSNWNRLDLSGSLFLILTVTSLVLGCNLRGILGSWTHPTILLTFMSCIISLGIFIRIERRAKLPLMPLKLLSTPPRAHLVFSNCFAYMGWSAMLFHAPLLFQCMKLDPTYHTGSRLAVPNIGVSLSGLFSGIMMTRTKRTRGLVIFGSVVSIVGTLALTMATRQMPSLALTAFMLITSFGMGLNTPAVSLAVIAASSQEDQAVMTTTLALWRRLGSAIGIAVGNSIMQAALLDGMEHRVTGARKDEIISSVRASTEAIRKLPIKHQNEVSMAYQGALQKTFCLTLLAYLMSLVLVVFLKFPRLQNYNRTSSRR